jgi:hypothetical protein
MAEKKRDPHIVALEVVHAALKDLDPADRTRVLSSVLTLLEIEGLPVVGQGVQLSVQADRYIAPTSGRPISLVELIQDKRPGTNAQRITLFAYYREKYENLPRFERDDLKPYFAKARQAPAANYDRDFVEAVKRGWIHEDGAESYLTSKGVEAIESGFEGERKYTKSRKVSPSPKRSSKRSRATASRKRKV